VPPNESELQDLEGVAATVDGPAGVPRPVMLRVAIESKFGLWPSESRVGGTSVVEPVPAKRARRRRRA
jgi:hypothetical protein